ncbi:hypothetical protein NUW58_g9836 [Xylaria curta]|uniref:Uncharacterized protein n=1 Tax=Xylaria curta TaxID=42375 RepID=A0ACC1MTN4_9PEZI|nr:hypothetical protein NUW58_g9836 [Xylaria curta]
MLVYAISSALCALSVILGLAAWALYQKQKPWRYRQLAIAHVLVSSLAFVFVVSGSTVVSIFASKSADIVNDLGKYISITAYPGLTFLKLSWAASALTLFDPKTIKYTKSKDAIASSHAPPQLVRVHAKGLSPSPSFSLGTPKPYDHPRAPCVGGSTGRLLPIEEVQYAAINQPPCTTQTISAPGPADDGRRAKNIGTERDGDIGVVGSPDQRPPIEGIRHTSTRSETRDGRKLVEIALSANTLDTARDDYENDGSSRCDDPAQLRDIIARKTLAIMPDSRPGLDVGELPSNEHIEAHSPRTPLSPYEPDLTIQGLGDDMDAAPTAGDTNFREPSSNPAGGIENCDDLGPTGSIDPSAVYQGLENLEQYDFQILRIRMKQQALIRIAQSLLFATKRSPAMAGPGLASPNSPTRGEVNHWESITQKRPRGDRVSGEPQRDMPQDSCWAGDLTQILSALSRHSDKKRVQLTLEIYHTFLQRAPSKESPLYGLMAHLSQCQRVEIFLHLLTSLGNCDELSEEASSVPYWFRTSLCKGRSVEETLVGKLLEVHRLRSAGTPRARGPAKRSAETVGTLQPSPPKPRRGSI